jgi:hypothetical protein
MSRLPNVGPPSKGPRPLRVPRRLGSCCLNLPLFCDHCGRLLPYYAQIGMNCWPPRKPPPIKIFDSFTFKAVNDQGPLTIAFVMQSHTCPTPIVSVPDWLERVSMPLLGIGLRSIRPAVPALTSRRGSNTRRPSRTRTSAHLADP